MLFSIVVLWCRVSLSHSRLWHDERDFRERCVFLSFSPRDVPTIQTDKGNPENGTGDAASSGKKKSGSAANCGKRAARGTPISFEGLRGKEKRKKRVRERSSTREMNISGRIPAAVYRAYREIWRGRWGRADRMREAQFSSGAEGLTCAWGRKGLSALARLSSESGSHDLRIPAMFRVNYCFRVLRCFRRK